MTSKFSVFLSWLLAVPLALVLMIHPALMLNKTGGYSHPLLMLVMLGVSIGFCHGVGFLPRHGMYKLLPILGWCLMSVGLVILYQAQIY